MLAAIVNIDVICRLSTYVRIVLKCNVLIIVRSQNNKKHNDYIRTFLKIPKKNGHIKIIIFISQVSRNKNSTKK